MDLSEAAPIIENIIKETLTQNRYPFGFSKFRGVGNKVASGKLRDSVKVISNNDAQGNSVLLVTMMQYAQWVQSGRLPGKKFVPIGQLEKWIKERGLKGRDKKGKFITNKSFAFAIAKNINKFGIRPSNFIDFSLEKIIDDSKIKEIIGDGAYEDLINAIEGI